MRSLYPVIGRFAPVKNAEACFGKLLVEAV